MILLDCPRIKVDGFGFLPQTNEIVRRYTIRNINNAVVKLITLGAGIQSITVPNKNGDKADVVLGFDNVEGYLENRYIGRIVGRVANPYSYKSGICPKEMNDFDVTNWNSYILGHSVVMTNIHHYGSSNYQTCPGHPGSLMTRVKYTWTNSNELHIKISARSMRPNPVNITNQCLFNLAGHGTGAKEMLNHAVTINADQYAQQDLWKNKTSTGDIVNVNDSVYDFRFPSQLNSKRMFLVPGGGYNHNLCINTPCGEVPYQFHARVLHPRSGRFLEVSSNQSVLQLYTGNDFPDPKKIDTPHVDDNVDIRNVHAKYKRIIGKDGILYKRFGCFGLMPHGCADVSNIGNFSSNILNPGEHFRNHITYSFGVS